MNIPADAKSTFLVCAFSMLGKLAEADGRVSPEEIARVERYVDQELKLDRKTRALALEVFNHAITSPLELRDYAEKFHGAYRDRVQLLDTMMEILIAVSTADRMLTAEEDKLLRSTALLFGLTEPGYKRIKEKYLPTGDGRTH